MIRRTATSMATARWRSTSVQAAVSSRSRMTLGLIETSRSPARMVSELLGHRAGRQLASRRQDHTLLAWRPFQTHQSRLLQPVSIVVKAKKLIPLFAMRSGSD